MQQCSRLLAGVDFEGNIWIDMACIREFVRMAVNNEGESSRYSGAFEAPDRSRHMEALAKVMERYPDVAKEHPPSMLDYQVTGQLSREVMASGFIGAAAGASLAFAGAVPVVLDGPHYPLFSHTEHTLQAGNSRDSRRIQSSIQFDS